MAKWWETAAGLAERMRQTLSRGVADRRAAARHPVLSSLAPDGAPQARVVVLRAFDPAAMTLQMHTDLTSGKIAGLRADPRVALTVWDPRARLQIRLSGRIEVQSGEAVAALWARVPPGSRAGYGAVPPPGTPIPEALAYDRPAAFEAFAVLTSWVEEADLLHLGEDGHRRLRLTRSAEWQPVWLAP